MVVAVLEVLLAPAVRDGKATSILQEADEAGPRNRYRFQKALHLQARLGLSNGRNGPKHALLMI